jgi:hypothetical protein
MILNTYAVLTAFVALVRLVLGGLVVAAGAAGLRHRTATPDDRARDEDRGTLTVLLAVVLVGLNLASWPLLYLLLQSYVPEWPGVMCVYGVTKIGEGSLGPSRHLPDLLRALQLAKPALVFAGGAWLALHLLNRRTRTAPLRTRLAALLIPLGGLAVADAAAELAYVAIPKKEVFPTAGCCTAGADDAERFRPTGRTGDADRPWLTATFYGANLCLIAALAAATRRPGPVPGSAGLALLLAGGAGALFAAGLFLVEVAAPTLLHLPYHHCPYDLIPRAPEAVLAVAGYAAGFFLLGWAGVLRWAGRCGEAEPFLGPAVRGLLRLSFWAYLASLAMLSLEMALA